MGHALGARRRWRGALVALAVTAMATLAGQASAAPAVQTWIGGSAGLTPDLQRDGFSLIAPDGSTITTNGIAGTINFTLDGTTYVGYCTDTNRIFSTGTEPVETTVQDPPATATARALTWIILNRTPTGASTPEKDHAGAVAQVATWILADPGINKDTPTSDSGLNQAAKDLVTEALAATAAPASVGVSATVPAAGATTSTLTVVGRPGATVDLAVASGPGTLSAGQVVIGAGGSATVTLTATGVGPVVITATTAGDGRLIDIDPTNVETTPQSTAAAEATTLSASAQVTFQAAPVTPVAPTVAVRAATPRVAITKSGPARAKVLSAVSYTITVRNTGKVTLRNVVLRDRLPRGLSFVRASRTSRVSSGNATFTIGSLAPGASRTVVVTLMANASVRGSRTNVATVSASSVRPKSAQAATVFRALVRRVQPAVTG